MVYNIKLSITNLYNICDILYSDVAKYKDK